MGKLKENRRYVRVINDPYNRGILGREGFYYAHLAKKANGKTLVQWYSKEGINPYRVTMALSDLEPIKPYKWEWYKMKSVDKITKKERKEYYKQFRRDWDGINPVTRKSKIYDGKQKIKGGIIN